MLDDTCHGNREIKEIEERGGEVGRTHFLFYIRGQGWSSAEGMTFGK